MTVIACHFCTHCNNYIIIAAYDVAVFMNSLATFILAQAASKYIQEDVYTHKMISKIAVYVIVEYGVSQNVRS